MPKRPEAIAIGARLRRARLACAERIGFGDKVVDAARFFGIDAHMWHAAENGWRPPSKETLPLYAKVLGVSIDYLLIGPDDLLETKSLPGNKYVPARLRRP